MVYAEWSLRMFAGSVTHAVSFLRSVAIDIVFNLIKQRSNNGIRKQISLENLFGRFVFI
ncbi:hypothetical protein VN1156_08340 [Helicobacter pylori]|nr:hypothetical protein VN1156_08340 [Helicobacter pylori]